MCLQRRELPCQHTTSSLLLQHSCINLGLVEKQVDRIRVEHRFGHLANNTLGSSTVAAVMDQIHQNIKTEPGLQAALDARMPPVMADFKVRKVLARSQGVTSTVCLPPGLLEVQDRDVADATRWCKACLQP